jgi:hypothetical protein
LSCAATGPVAAMARTVVSARMDRLKADFIASLP